MQSMKSILVREFGGPEVLSCERTRQPECGPAEVFVQIHAAGVGPWVPGYEVVKAPSHLSRFPTFLG
jgi:D-arabinose 1-dehydrogenase-like Zn-dependent alcohol dehydrogenase